MDRAISSHRYVRILSGFAILLAFTVVILGAFTRLSDAGLGCPDWPGCYGHWTVPDTAKSILKADLLYPNQPVEADKAWPEMIHRYAAGTLGLLVIILAVTAVVNRRKFVNEPIAIPLALVALIIFQAALGKWTVTMKLLPAVVMSHLIGGMTVLALLWLLRLQLGQELRTPNLEPVKKYRVFGILGLLVVIGQIMLGGWTSANYAALACPDFPFCHGQIFPIHEFKNAFNVMMPVGANFQGGLLDSAERVTIQMMHRLGALITTLYFLWLGFWIIITSSQKQVKYSAVAVLLILFVQLSLGILNVELMLPLPVAVMHNACAALLLLAVVTLNYTLYAKKSN